MKVADRKKRSGLRIGAEYGEPRKGRGNTTHSKINKAPRAPQLLKVTAA